MKNFLLIALICLISTELYSQDERFFRKIYSDDLINKKTTGDELINHHWKVRSKFHEIDLDDDGEMEGIVLEKKDQENWIHLFTKNGKKISSFELETKGINANLYRISIRKISKKSKLLVLHFFEGVTEHLDFEGSSRFYFITIDEKKTETLSMYKGPVFWHEKKENKNHYHQREYLLSFKDLDNDGILEVILNYHTIKNIFKYSPMGKWTNI